MQAVAPATARFQLAIPHILGPVSPGLAALHASRARRLHPSDPTLRTTHCPTCGAGYLDGGGEYRSVRSNGNQRRMNRKDKTQPRRLLCMSCGICGHREELPVDQDGVPPFVQSRQRNVVVSNAETAEALEGNALAAKSGKAAHAWTESKPAGLGTSGNGRQHSSKAGSVRLQGISPSVCSEGVTMTPTAGAARPKAKSKASSGLQGLLARSREKQEQEKKSAGPGLSAFLQALG
ncbi:hypothetical protein DAEQUDRAFT_189834 [Daedalea quercina L-15889]|uniref:Rpr2-domain-containing protein n=1 Tax=Daedalea quercina L-15889 TaxID=1314783 RepID=A0A165U426_9APHY|nr:hypothetical protein DAEQUDRAFT_189834 [Daedalea quercina L-15889]